MKLDNPALDLVGETGLSDRTIRRILAPARPKPAPDVRPIQPPTEQSTEYLKDAYHAQINAILNRMPVEWQIEILQCELDARKTETTPIQS